MRGVSSSLAVLYILAGLLLIQVLATPEATFHAANSEALDLRTTVRQLEGRSAENSPLGLRVKDVPRTSGAQPNIAVRAADTVAADEESQIRRDHITGRDQASPIHLGRDASAKMLVVEEQNGDLTKSSLVLRSAAPKVFGISIYLIIAWLALMYLMYRTGSF